MVLIALRIACLGDCPLGRSFRPPLSSGIWQNKALVKKMRFMVQDRVNNRLTVWLSLSDVQARVTGEGAREDREAVSVAAARAVSLELEKLSFEELRSWERRNTRFLYSSRLL